MTCSACFIGCSLAAALSVAALPPASAGSCTSRVHLTSLRSWSCIPRRDATVAHLQTAGSARLRQRGITADKAVLLAFHVDYWDQLGWPDRFSQMRFSERQRGIAARSRTRSHLYPQLVLDGHDLRAGTRPENLDGKSSIDQRGKSRGDYPCRYPARARVIPSHR